ncbi:hypothetical protein [Burkholderia pseudomallei]|uniref:hypothetical protein n=1 Tax=Burkholderia pseudomallei TaxID=28450 RepID=UPI0018A7C2B0|nr:hypothetical protein [Burkholderia pseudomallei]
MNILDALVTVRAEEPRKTDQGVCSPRCELDRSGRLGERHNVTASVVTTLNTIRDVFIEHRPYHMRDRRNRAR